MNTNYSGKGRDRSGKNSICKGPEVGRGLTKGLCDWGVEGKGERQEMRGQWSDRSGTHRPR